MASLTSLPRALSLSRTTRVAIPIRSCSRCGLPCRFRCRTRGALLPHLFTLTHLRSLRCYGAAGPRASRTEAQRAEAGGSFSVALSLGLPPPDVIRHRMSMEPGLSSPSRKRPSGRLTVNGMGVMADGVKPLTGPQWGPKIIIVKMSFRGTPLRLVLDPEVRKHSRQDLMRISGSKSTSNPNLKARFGFESPVERLPRNVWDPQTTALRTGDDAVSKGAKRCSIC
jgi:hypothetical protein